nr:MAG: hypothetical protein DIU52_01395 [bacterium]
MAPTPTSRRSTACRTWRRSRAGSPCSCARAHRRSWCCSARFRRARSSCSSCGAMSVRRSADSRAAPWPRVSAGAVSRCGTRGGGGSSARSRRGSGCAARVVSACSCRRALRSRGSHATRGCSRCSRHSIAWPLRRSRGSATTWRSGSSARRRRRPRRRDAMSAAPDLRRFREAYAAHRASEGRGSGGEAEALALPWLRTGPQRRQWAVRARTFERFLDAVVAVRALEVSPRPLRVLDLGAGNGWLCYRLARLGHRCVAIDLRDDAVDGLRAADAYRAHLPAMFGRVAASFEALPIAARVFDIAVFNAALHYALDLRRTLEEAARVVVAGGRIAILDSPFYREAVHGEAMVREKRAEARLRFGARADVLTAPPFIEYLTADRLEEASSGLGLRWRRRRVRYPLAYELRPLIARLRRRRPPSRFDLWEATVP